MRKSQNRSKTDKDKALAPVPFLSCPRLFGGGRCRPSRFILPKNQSFSTLSAAHKPSKAPATTSEGQWSPVSTRDQLTRRASAYQSHLRSGYSSARTRATANAVDV